MKYQPALSLYRAFLNAGFSIASMKQYETLDGVAFDVEVKWQGKPVASAHNDGHGGGSFLHAVFGSSAAEAQGHRNRMKEAIGVLQGLPEVQLYLQDLHLQILGYQTDIQGEDRKKEVDRIMAKQHELDEEEAADMLAELGDVKKLIAKIKRLSKNAILVARENDNVGEYSQIKLLDSPENRKRVELANKKILVGHQGYLIDLIRGL